MFYEANAKLCMRSTCKEPGQLSTGPFSGGSWQMLQVKHKLSWRLAQQPVWSQSSQGRLGHGSNRRCCSCLAQRRNMDVVQGQIQPRQTALKQKPVRPGYKYVHDPAPQPPKQAPHKSAKRRAEEPPLPGLLPPPPRSAEAILEEIRAAPGKTQRRVTLPASRSAPLPVVKPQAAQQALPPPLLTPPARPVAAVVEEIQQAAGKEESRPIEPANDAAEGGAAGKEESQPIEPANDAAEGGAYTTTSSGSDGPHSEAKEVAENTSLPPPTPSVDATTLTTTAPDPPLRKRPERKTVPIAEQNSDHDQQLQPEVSTSKLLERAARLWSGRQQPATPPQQPTSAPRGAEGQQNTQASHQHSGADESRAHQQRLRPTALPTPEQQEVKPRRPGPMGRPASKLRKPRPAVQQLELKRPPPRKPTPLKADSRWSHPAPHQPPE